MVVGVTGRALHTRAREDWEAEKETSTLQPLQQPTSTSQTLILPKQHERLGGQVFKHMWRHRTLKPL